MEKDDGFSVGFDDSIFELAGTAPNEKTESVSLATDIESTQEIKSANNNKNKYSYETVYEWFVKDKSPTVSFEQYLRTKPEVYRIFNLDPFQILPPNIMQIVEEFRVKCHSDVDKNLQYDTEAIEKGARIKECVDEIRNVFKYYPDNNFKTELKRNLYEKLYVSLKEKEANGVIDLSEIGALLGSAKQLYLWDGESNDAKKEILGWIKTKAAEDGCKIESYLDSFIRLVKEKKLPVEKLRVDKCEERLYWEYQSLKFQELQIYDMPIKINHDELRSEMKANLEKYNLLKDPEEVYLNEFFYNERERSGKNFSVKLPLEYYQYLKTVALYKYLFTEKQWIDFARRQKISSISEISVAFILGTEKASSIGNIVNLLENNKTKAIERIIDGDLETYLIHIEKKDLAKKIEIAKNSFKNSRDALFENVLNILRGIKTVSREEPTESDNDRQTLLALIDRDASVQDMVKYLLKRKTKEKLNQRILNYSKDRQALNEYLSHKNVSFVCLCMNYLRDFPNESNASGYKNIYEMYANCVLDILIEKNAFNLFFSGFWQLINLDYVSQKFKDKLNETAVKMQASFEQFCNDVSKNGKKKSFFGFK